LTGELRKEPGGQSWLGNIGSWLIAWKFLRARLRMSVLRFFGEHRIGFTPGRHRDAEGGAGRRTLSTPERKCISAPEQRCIDEECREGPAGTSGGLARMAQGHRFARLVRGEAVRAEWSVPAKSSRWVDCLKLGQVELADCPQSISGGAVLQVVRQCFQPDGVLRL
jgi:hypothetical protein